ncbi:MAG: RNA polymerase sigma factor [Bacteroidota bacterium]
MSRELQLIKIIATEAGVKKEQAFAALYRKYYTMVFNRIKKDVKDPRDAEELTTDVFNSTYRYLSAGKWQYGQTIKPFLYKVAGNLIINHWRVKKLTTYMDTLDANRPTAPEIESDINQEFLKKLISDLPEKKQRTFELSLQGYSHEEIAAMVGWQGKDSSKSQLAKIRKFIINKFNQFKSNK